MGKVAERRKARRQQYLSALAISKPERFRDEWNKRIESWAEVLWIRAGRLVDANGKPIASAFEVVDEARRILADCKESQAVLDALSSVDVLRHEACRALSRHIDSRLYRITSKLDKRHQR